MTDAPIVRTVGLDHEYMARVRRFIMDVTYAL